LPKGFESELQKQFPELVSSTVFPGKKISALFGIAIPEKRFVICDYCLRGYTDTASFYAHKCRSPAPDLIMKYSYSLVQTVFKGPQACWFPIYDPTSDAVSRDDLHLFKASFRDIEESRVTYEVENYRELDQFLAKEGWIAHVAHLPREELCDLVALPPKKDPLLAIQGELFNLMAKIQVAIQEAGFYVRRLLGQRPS
jgi:hypothetical protein